VLELGLQWQHLALAVDKPPAVVPAVGLAQRQLESSLSTLFDAQFDVAREGLQALARKSQIFRHWYFGVVGEALFTASALCGSPLIGPSARGNNRALIRCPSFAVVWRCRGGPPLKSPVVKLPDVIKRLPYRVITTQQLIG
jgi:hypothetical protein